MVDLSYAVFVLLPPKMLEAVVGKRVVRDVEKNTAVGMGDFLSKATE